MRRCLLQRKKEREKAEKQRAREDEKEKKAIDGICDAIIMKLSASTAGLNMVKNDDRFQQVPSMLKDTLEHARDKILAADAEALAAKAHGDKSLLKTVTTKKECGPLCNEANKIQALITTVFAQMHAMAE